MGLVQIGPTITATGGGANTATTVGTNTTGATLLIITVGGGASIPTATVSDSNGNTWHSRQNETNTNGFPNTGIWYAFDKSGSALVTGAGHTVTVSGIINLSITFSAFSGSLPNHVDPYDSVAGENGGNNGTVGALTVQPGSITAIQGSLVVATIGMSGNASLVGIDSGFLIGGSVAAISGTNYGSGVAFNGNVTTSNPTWTTNTAPPSVATIASFKAAPNIAPASIYLSDSIVLTDALLYNPFLTDQLQFTDSVFISLNYQALITNEQIRLYDFANTFIPGLPPPSTDSEVLSDDAQLTLSSASLTMSFLDASITIVVPGDGLALSDASSNLFPTFIVGDTASGADAISLSDSVQFTNIASLLAVDQLIQSDSMDQTIVSIQDNYLRRYLGDVGGT